MMGTMMAMMVSMMGLQFFCVIILIFYLFYLVEPLNQKRKLIELRFLSPQNHLRLHIHFSFCLCLSLHLSFDLLHSLVSDLPEPLHQQKVSLVRQTKILLVHRRAAHRADVVEEENGCTEDYRCNSQTFRFLHLPYPVLDCFPVEKLHSRDQFFSLGLILLQTAQSERGETLILLGRRLV